MRRRPERAFLIAALVLLGMLTPARSAYAGGPPAPAVRRIAVLVGANQAAAGRQPLRYAYRDADKMARVLSQVGGFDPADVHVLREPEPAEVLALLDREASRIRAQQKESLLFFYFSGHADEEAVYSRGRPLLLSALRERLDDPAATVRIGFIDACRGGGWTRAKGLTPAAPFAINLPEPGLSNEGAAFLAASSGLENAHESEHIKGSFFTHHFAAGLLGAADQTGDGAVSLNEAFDYAKQLTIRDTATFAGTAQHPSFDLKLRGRQELTLAQVTASHTLVQVHKVQGPLEIIHLPSGLVVAELGPGRGDLRIALPVGKYIARRRQQRALYALGFEVERGKECVLREQDLKLLGREQLAIKGWDGAGRAPKPPPYSTESTPPRKMVELRTALGIRYRDFGYSGIGLSQGAERSFSFIFSGAWGLTDRLQWSVGTPALAYRFGRRGGIELIPWGGVISWGLRYIADTGVIFSYGLGAGLDLRAWIGENQSLILGIGLTSEGAAGAARRSPDTWHTRIGLGYSLSIRRAVTFNLACVLEQDLLHEGRLTDPDYRSEELDLTLRVGAVQSIALRPLPLVQVHLNSWISIDGYAGFAVKLRDGSMQEHYMLGTTFTVF